MPNPLSATRICFRANPKNARLHSLHRIGGTATQRSQFRTAIARDLDSNYTTNKQKKSRKIFRLVYINIFFFPLDIQTLHWLFYASSVYSATVFVLYHNVGFRPARVLPQKYIEVKQ